MNSDIKLAAVDATEHGELADKFGVKGYPTLKFFPKGSTTPVDYEGGRTADTIVSWVNEKVGTNRKVKIPPSHVATLTAENFDATVLGSKAALVEFYAPWCGHCKKLAPIWDELGAKVKEQTSNIIIAKMDSTANEVDVPNLAVKGFPTIYFFKGNDKANPIAYNDGRDLESFLKFLNTNAHPSFEHEEL